MTEMTDHGGKFGRKKEEAIVALLSNRSIEDAAPIKRRLKNLEHA